MVHTERKIYWENPTNSCAPRFFGGSLQIHTFLREILMAVKCNIVLNNSLPPQGRVDGSGPPPLGPK